MAIQTVLAPFFNEAKPVAILLLTVAMSLDKIFLNLGKLVLVACLGNLFYLSANDVHNLFAHLILHRSINEQCCFGAEFVA